MVAFPKTPLQGDGGCAGSTGESPALHPVGEQGDALAQSSTRNQSQVPGLCSTLGLLPHSHAGKLYTGGLKQMIMLPVPKLSQMYFNGSPCVSTEPKISEL